MYQMKFKNILLTILLASGMLYSSGGYDHGTSTGRGQLELDFTWNPFDIIEFGQTYVVFGYGLTDRLDIHGYFSHQADGKENYYYGIFYQFLDTKYLDLSSAIGRREYTESEVNDIFFPQLLFMLKMSNTLQFGGAYVNIQRQNNNVKGSALDLAFYIPLSQVMQMPKFVDEIKFALGAFNPGLFDLDQGEFLPTYSIDITFKKFGGEK